MKPSLFPAATLVAACLALPLAAQSADLPVRDGPKPQTSAGVPHVQIGAKLNPALNDVLLRRVAACPDVTLAQTRVSLPGAVGFHLDDAMALANPQVIVRGREFAHMHPDGSLHASLEPAIAKAAIAAGWAIAHPWADKREGWGGFVMIYSPTSNAELDVVLQLVEGSYTYVTGQALP